MQRFRPADYLTTPEAVIAFLEDAAAAGWQVWDAACFALLDVRPKSQERETP